MYLKQMQYSSLSFHIVPTGKSQNKVKYPSQPVCFETTCKSLYGTIKIKQTILRIENTCKSLFEHRPFCALIKSRTIIRRCLCIDPLMTDAKQEIQVQYQTNFVY